MLDMEPKRSETLPAAEHLSRPVAIERLRKVMKALTDEENCMCTAATRLGIFCQGFRHLSDEEFRQRFDWIARKRPGASREELERVVSLYHCGRQQVTGAALCCDIETREHEGCDGWNSFDNRALEAFYLQMTGRRAEIG
jgi:hypothetical protein